MEGKIAHKYPDKECMAIKWYPITILGFMQTRLTLDVFIMLVANLGVSDNGLDICSFPWIWGYYIFSQTHFPYFSC